MLIRKIVLQPINLANAPKRSTDKIALVHPVEGKIYVQGGVLRGLPKGEQEGEVSVDRMPLGIPLCDLPVDGPYQRLLGQRAGRCSSTKIPKRRNPDGN